jgi:transposase-like protein
MPSAKLNEAMERRREKWKQCGILGLCASTFMRNVLAHAGESGRRVVSAFIAIAFAQETPEAASLQWLAVADQIRPKVPKLATSMGASASELAA